MIPFNHFLQFSARSAGQDPSPLSSCPTTTVKPDANGWVPPGSCGYISRPYYPSFVSALVFCAAAVLVLLGFSLLIARSVSRRRQQPRDERALPWAQNLLLSWMGALIAAFLLAAYILRAFGTKHQQVPAFVVFSDTLVLVCPILIFAFDCTVLIRLMTAYCQDETIAGVTGPVLARALLVTIPLLAIEQLSASVLIAPKDRSSSPGNTSSTAMIGLKLYLIGIGFQEVFVVYALVVAILLSKKLRDNEVLHLRSKMAGGLRQSPNQWHPTMYSLIFSLAAIGLRIAYRLVELSGIFTGYLRVLMHNEIFFYALECLPVLAALGVWTIVGFEDLLDHSSLRTNLAGTYTYHEISRQFEEDHSISLERTDVEDGALGM